MNKKLTLVILIIVAVVVGVLIGYSYKAPAKTENAGAVALSTSSYFYGLVKDTKTPNPTLPTSLRCTATNQKGVSESGVLNEDGSCLGVSYMPKDSAELSNKMIGYATSALASSGTTVTNPPVERTVCFVMFNTYPTVIACHHRFLLIGWWTYSY